MAQAMHSPAQRRVVLLAGPSASGKIYCSPISPDDHRGWAPLALTVSMDDDFTWAITRCSDGTENFRSLKP